MDSSERAGEELPPDGDGHVVRHVWVSVHARADEGNGLRDDVVGGDDQRIQVTPAVSLHHLPDTPMVDVVWSEEGEEEAGVEEDQRSVVRIAIEVLVVVLGNV